MILEAIVTTINPDGSLNVSPMGPTVNQQMDQFELRPFDTSRTFANLKRGRAGVLHVTDDVLLFAQTAIGHLDAPPPTRDADQVNGKILTTACRYFEFEVGFIDTSGPRMSINCNVVARGRLRDFFGFNRAKHAVLEAAILATRLDFLPAEEIRDSLNRLQTIVKKTAGPREHQAMQLITEYVQDSSVNRS